MFLKIWISIFIAIAIATTLFGGYIIYLEYKRAKTPYKLFQQHAKKVLKGKYKVQRDDREFTIKTPFVQLEVKEELPFQRKRGLRIRANSGSKLFSFLYDPQKKEVEEFQCSQRFAQVANESNFPQLLKKYIDYVFEQEYGCKSEREKMIQNLKKTPVIATAKPKSNEEIVNILRSIYSIETSHYYPLAVVQLLGHIEQVAQTIEEHPQALDIVAQHEYEKLLQNRIPNLLKFAEDKKNEEDIVQALQEASKKMKQWQSLLEKENQQEFQNEFQKELFLMRSITK